MESIETAETTLNFQCNNTKQTLFPFVTEINEIWWKKQWKHTSGSNSGVWIYFLCIGRQWLLLFRGIEKILAHSPSVSLDLTTLWINKRQQKKYYIRGILFVTSYDNKRNFFLPSLLLIHELWLDHCKNIALRAS